MRRRLKLNRRIPRPMSRPRVLTEYEIGRCMQSIEDVELLGKPIADVCGRYAKPSELKADLRECLRSRGMKKIKFWIRQHVETKGFYSYGFYKEPWTLAAMDFVYRSKLGELNRSWIQGLLFGYRPESIQEFIDKKVLPRRSKRATKR